LEEFIFKGDNGNELGIMYGCVKSDFERYPVGVSRFEVDFGVTKEI
jgi:hypothetical protein